ncbi:glycosyltransferase family 2 protein [Flexithrix dorotheae]|uniref:glycosyltransferase family 2 protein n=1 Tax=Flexithrix dorotheae TaxID=70993 RepID=UPI00037B5F19|nr:glycosyltransferase family 2 protein [Flexithrix dorotheae]
MESKPKVTIITVVYNEAENVEKTINSVLNQTYSNLEYLVIDGGSTDGSNDVIKKYEGKIDYWQSEKDQGVFDAMNKGVKKATGDYINFMNAGDSFFNEKVIEEVFRSDHRFADFIYGDHQVIHETFIKEKKALPLSQLWKHMIFSHQSLFVKTHLLQENPFDLSFKIAADFNFIFNSYIAGRTFYNTGLKIAKYAAGGQSEMEVIKAYRENWKIVRQHEKRIKVRLFHFQLIFKQSIIILIRRILPYQLFEQLMKLKNSI